MSLYFENKFVEDLFSAIDKKNMVVETSVKFRKLRRDSDRVAFAYNLLKKEGIFPRIQQIKCEKNAQTSLDLRNEGNLAFQKKQYEGAIILYNKSMSYAPVGSKEFALAIGNRSAVNLSQRCYSACLKDIHLAIESGYPQDLLYKLFYRKAKCLIAQEKCDEALQAIRKAEEYLQELNGNQLKQQKLHLDQLKRDLKELGNKSNDNGGNIIESPEEGLEITQPECSYDLNKEILCASSSIELKFDTNMGRHIVATQDISPGDVLVVEQPYASVLLTDSYATHCYHCLKRCFSPVPCLNCSTVVFCNISCRTISWHQNHHIDCPLLPTLAVSVGKMGHLALKVLLTATQQGTGLKLLYERIGKLEGLDADPRCLGFNSNNQYDSANYQTIHSLIGNTDLRSNDDLFRRAIIAACLLYCLDSNTKFFQGVNENSEETNENKNKNVQATISEHNVNLMFFAGGLMLRYLQSIPCNAHEVAELVFRPSPTDGKPSATAHETCEIGAALYAGLSLFNHSCNPNAVRFSYLDCSVLRAIRTIKAGEQVVDNYGYHYALHTLKERKLPLEQQYYFTCKCEACTEDWPLYKNLPNEKATIVCSCGSVLLDTKETKGDVVCSQCGSQTDYNLLKSQLEISVEKYSAILNRVINEPPKQSSPHDVEEIVAHLKFLHCIKQPWRDYSGCQELLKMFFLLHASHCIFS